MEKNDKHVHWFTHSESPMERQHGLYFTLEVLCLLKQVWDMLEPNCRHLTSISWNLSWWRIYYRIFLQSIGSHKYVSVQVGVYVELMHLWVKSFNKPHTHKKKILSVDSLFHTTPSEILGAIENSGCFDSTFLWVRMCHLSRMCERTCQVSEASSFSPYTPSFW